ncbi:rod shape-determining protein MreD [uncultured Roseovarius sp.]|uniref:rod shape-determining protein MreD n=1 Tax=uncultured Roseovarius sp. TaxID=293344 RepID=UPI0025928B36|nr:rod shape-determining protein MreD [uncultured Roseovarius sp.]
MRILYLVLCLALVFLHLLPLDTLPRGWAGPDLMLAMTFAWVLRRPDYVPPLLIAGVFLLADLLFQRPPGLWAAFVLISSQTLRNREAGLRDLTFAMEWLNVATTLVALTIGYRIVLTIMLVDQVPLGLSLMQLVATLVVYPLVAFASQAVLRVRKIAPGDVDALGGRT